MRLSIDITPEQHQCLKAAAALQGKTIKDYVLERALTGLGDAGQADLRALEALLNTRIEASKAGVSDKSVGDIADEVLKTENRR
jgi:hypothetical protein